MGDDPLSIAHEARNLATRAIVMVETLQPQLSGIERSLSDMRRENTEQHRENGRIVADGLKEVHARISTIKTTIDANRITAAAEIKAVDDKLDEKITAHIGLWVKHKDKVLWLALALAVGLLADKLGVKVPNLL